MNSYYCIPTLLAALFDPYFPHANYLWIRKLILYLLSGFTSFEKAEGGF